MVFEALKNVTSAVKSAAMPGEDMQKVQTPVPKSDKSSYASALTMKKEMKGPSLGMDALS